MPITRPPYSPEFRQQVIDLARAGRDPAACLRSLSQLRRRSTSGLLPLAARRAAGKRVTPKLRQRTL